MDSQRYRIDVAYDGSAYAGWQVQPAAVTVQQRIEDALAVLYGTPVKVHGSGRTDQGVHARRQVAHVDLPAGAMACAALQRALNALLPEDIRILRAAGAAPAFHARRSATGKEYRYCIWNGPVVPPFICRYRTHVRRPLDAERLTEAAARLVGRHDFASFTANPNRAVATTVRRLDRLDVRRHGCELTIVAAAEGLLSPMVRSLAGFLIRVGEGAEPPRAATEVLHARQRTARVPTAPAAGLFLWKVTY